MQEENSHQHAQLKKGAVEKKKIRAKGENIGINYNCKCGKSYLYYPSLYCHIKSKHGGDKSYEKKQVFVKNFARMKQQFEKDAKAIQKDLDRLENLLEKHFHFQNESVTRESVMKALEEVEAEFWEPIIEECHGECFQEEMNEHLEEEKKIREWNTKRYQNIKKKLDFVMGKFLFKMMKKKVSLRGILFLSRFLIMLRRALCLKHGSTFSQNDNSASTTPKQFNWLISQKILTTDFYGHHPSILNDQPLLIPNESIVNDQETISQILHIFASWLYSSYYTDYTVHYH